MVGLALPGLHWPTVPTNEPLAIVGQSLLAVDSVRAPGTPCDARVCQVARVEDADESAVPIRALHQPSFEGVLSGVLRDEQVVRGRARAIRRRPRLPEIATHNKKQTPSTSQTQVNFVSWWWFWGSAQYIGSTCGAVILWVEGEREMTPKWRGGGFTCFEF